MGELVSEPGCSRIVTRGQNVFQVGQVEVSIKERQTSSAGASMNIELPMCRTASEAAMLFVDRLELVGSDGTGEDAIVVVISRKMLVSEFQSCFERKVA